MIHLLDSFQWHNLLNPQFYIEHGGLWVIFIIVFAETGLFIGFFFPGDSLLFLAGIFAQYLPDGEPGLAHQFLKLTGLGNSNNEWLSLFVLIILISFAGIIGNLVGYWFGKKSGPFLYERKDTFFFKKKYLLRAAEFYALYGGWAIVAARFIPIVRTFAPIVAGIVQMNKKKFFFFNVMGCLAWVTTMIFAGHFLNKWIKEKYNYNLTDHLEIIIILIVLFTTLPVIYKFFFAKNKPDSENTLL